MAKRGPKEIRPWSKNKKTGGDGQAPKPPDCLDDLGKKEFRRVVKWLEKNHMLNSTDTALLTGYCQSWSQYQRLTAQINAPEAADLNPVDFRRLLTTANEVYSVMHRAAKQFGLSPLSRKGVSVVGDHDKDDDANPLAIYFNRA